MAGGRQRRPLQEEKSCLREHECSSSRDKVSGQTAMPDPPLLGEEVSGKGKTMQNLYCSYLRQVGMQVPPWGAR